MSILKYGALALAIFLYICYIFKSMKKLSPYQVKLIETLIDSKALAFGEFTLKSGRKSPYFCNMGIAISNGSYLNSVAECYCEKILDTIKEGFTFIFGPAYKGIPLASSISQMLYSNYGISKRWGYDRKEAKGYGDARDKVLVGDIHDEDEVIMIDDVITTGGTKVEAWKKIGTLAGGLRINGIFVAVDREEKDENGDYAKDALERNGLVLHSIITASEIFDYLHNREIKGRIVVDDDLYQMFKEYKKRY